MRKSLFLALAGLTVLGLAAAAPAYADVRVTPASSYVRHDGGTDRAIQHCSDTSTSNMPDVPGDGDADSNDGGAFRQGNEPSVAIDPTNPNLVFASWNDYCDTDLGGGWQGLAFSTNRGGSWTPSKIPGYPSDTSAEGIASPLHGRQAEAGDPLLAFDRTGRSSPGLRSTGSIRRTAMSGSPATQARWARAVIEGLDDRSRQRTPALNGIFETSCSRSTERAAGSATSTSAGRASSASTAGRRSPSAARRTRGRRSRIRSSCPSARTCRAATSRSSTTATSTSRGARETRRPRTPRRASPLLGPLMVERALHRPTRSRPSPATSRRTGPAIVVTGRSSARAGSCSSGSRSSRG
jgi:hypothetical protein